MKLNYYLFAAFICSLFLISCDASKTQLEEQVKKNAALQKRVNELEQEDALVRGEYSEAIETLNAIEDTLRIIASREREIQKLSNDPEFSGSLSQKQAIMAKLEALNQANQNAKDEAKRLQSKVKSVKIENQQLKKMIAQSEARLLDKERELQEAQTVIDDMRLTLNKLEGQLLEKTGELNNAYADLKRQRDELAQTNGELQRTISELQNKTSFIDQQAKGYVVCGTVKELRRNKILASTTRKLRKDYQDAVQGNASIVDYFKSNEFTCGSGGVIEDVLPERSSSSYEIKGNKLIVKDSKKFWATDKIVVLIKSK